VKGVIIVVLVVCALIGGLLTLRSTRNSGMPDQDVLDRAKERAKSQAAAEKDEDDA
jgi:hypothetical protein